MLRTFCLTTIGMSALALMGCESIHPNDLRLRSASIATLANTPGIWVGADARTDLGKERILLLSVKISSKMDLIKFSKDYSYTVHSVAALCLDDKDSSTTDEIHVLPTLRVAGKSLKSGLDYPEENLESARHVDGTILYEAVVPIAGDEARKAFGNGFPTFGGKSSQQYDIATMKQDLCIYLQGGMVMKGAFRSNIVRVPRQTIAAAIESGPAKSIPHHLPE